MPESNRSAEMVHYPRLYWSFVRYCLVRELGFRFNFIARGLAGVGWLCLLVFFFEVIFGNTRAIGDWSRDEYLFLMGTWFVLYGIVEMLFLTNFTRFSELIRTGNLDFVLTKPVDEQFLVSSERVDWAELPGIVFGMGLCVYAAVTGALPVTITKVGGYILLLIFGIGILYSFMLMLASLSVWIVRTQSLHEMWFYVVQFGRYPSEIYGDYALGIGIRFLLMYLIPVLLAVNIPSRLAVKSVDDWFVGYMMAVTIALLFVSRWFFQKALRAYRSASS